MSPLLSYSAPSLSSHCNFPTSTRAVTILMSIIYLQVLQYKSVNSPWAVFSYPSLNLWFLAKGLTYNRYSIYIPWAEKKNEWMKNVGKLKLQKKSVLDTAVGTSVFLTPHVKYSETSNSLQECRRGGRHTQLDFCIAFNTCCLLP